MRDEIASPPIATLPARCLVMIGASLAWPTSSLSPPTSRKGRTTGGIRRR